MVTAECLPEWLGKELIKAETQHETVRDGDGTQHLRMVADGKFALEAFDEHA